MKTRVCLRPFVNDYCSYMNVCIPGNDDTKKGYKSSSPDNLTRLIITQSEVFSRKGIEKVNKSVWAFLYLVFTSQV